MAHIEIYPSSTHATTGLASAAEQVESERREVAQKHLRDSSSVAPSRAEQRSVLLRSPIMWSVLYLPALAVLAVLAFMALHLERGPARVGGLGDLGSPNAQPGDK